MSTSIDWPSTLPQGFERGSWQYSNYPNIATSDMEVGETKVRLRETTSQDKFSGTLLLSAEQVSILKDFLETTIARGTLSFNFPDYLLGLSREVYLDISSGDSLYDFSQTGDNTFEMDIKLKAVKS